jgi:hypothetical protein
VLAPLVVAVIDDGEVMVVVGEENVGIRGREK